MKINIEITTKTSATALTAMEVLLKKFDNDDSELCGRLRDGIEEINKEAFK